MVANGSPRPQFESDDSTYVLVRFLARISTVTNQATNQAKHLYIKSLDDLKFFINQATNQATNQVLEALDKGIHSKVKQMLALTLTWQTRKAILEHIGVTNQTFNRKKFLDPLTEIGWIIMKHPENESHPDQAYQLSESGRRLLDLIKD